MKKKTVILMLAAILCMTTGCGKTTGISSELKANEPEQISIIECEGDYHNLEPKVEINEFSLQLFNKNIDEKNPFLSPLSAYLALNMVAEGAGGNTKAEFEKVMGSLNYQEQISRLVRDSLEKDSDEMKFTIQDSAWIDDEFDVNNEWLNKILANDGSRAFNADLSAQKTVEDMNQWISDSTNGMIEKMINQPFYDSARLVLFDAVYMKAKWLRTFEAYATHAEPFKLSDGTSKDTQMMNMRAESFEYFDNETLEGTILPYKDSSLAFVAIKTKDENDNIKDQIKNLSADDINKLIKRDNYRSINLKLPKFDITFDKELTDSLAEMGIKDAFDSENADFKAIGQCRNGRGIFINLVRQKARIKLDEEGTEAAAVTEILMTESCALMEDLPYDMYFEQPFFYMIMDMDNNIPVFMGVMDDPTDK